MNKKNIALLSIAVVVIGGFFGFKIIKQMIIESNPVNHLLYSMTQTKFDSALESSVEVKFELDEKGALRDDLISNSWQNPKKLQNFQITY